MSDNMKNYEPDGLGHLKDIKRIPGIKSCAPKIAWGDTYKTWDVEKRLEWAEKIAATMNHAADVLQKERNKLVDVCEKQERQLKHTKNQYLQQGELMHSKLASQDAEKQKLYQQIVSQGQEIKQLKRSVKQLEVLLQK